MICYNCNRIDVEGLNDKEVNRVIQCVAVCCSVLQCVAVCCSVLQCVAVNQLNHNDVL